MLTATMRIAYAQVDSFLSLLDKKYVEMVPRNIRYFFKQEMDKAYDKPVVADVPIKNQNLTDEAIALIAYLNLNYWCKDAEEKEELKKKYMENDAEYSNKVINNQYSTDKSKEKSEEKIVNDSNVIHDDNTYNKEDKMVVYKKDNILKKILLGIKSKFS